MRGKEKTTQLAEFVPYFKILSSASRLFSERPYLNVKFYRTSRWNFENWTSTRRVRDFFIKRRNREPAKFCTRQWRNAFNPRSYKPSLATLSFNYSILTGRWHRNKKLFNWKVKYFSSVRILSLENSMLQISPGFCNGLIDDRKEMFSSSSNLYSIFHRSANFIL